MSQYSTSYVFREMQIRITIIYTKPLSEWPKSRTLITPNAGENGGETKLIHVWW
jgi:hypothetical protein